MKARLAAGDYSVPAACLATVLDHFGRQLPLGVLADALGPASSVTASDMASVAEAQGLTSRVLSAVDIDFAAIATPAVVRISGGKWLVLLKYGHRRVAIANPTRGVQRMDTEEFQASVTEVIVLQPGEQFTRVRRPSLLGQLLRILPPAVVRGQIWILLLTLVSIVPVILIPLLLRSFVDLYLVAGISDVALQVLGAVILLAALQLGILWLQNWALVRGGAAVDISLMLAMARGIVYSPQRFRQQRSTYELATRTNEVQVLGQLVAGQLARGIAGILVFVAATALMFVLSPLLALLSTGILLVGLVVHRSLSAKALLSSQLGSVQRRQLHAEAGQSVDNFETLKSLGHTHVLFDRFGSRLAKAKTTMIRDDVEWQRPFTSWLIVTVGARLAILIVGAQLVLTDRTSIGTVVAIQALVGSQILPLLDLVQAQELMIKARSAVVALDDVTSVPAKGAPQSSPSPSMGARESEREGRLPVQSTLPSASVRFADLAFGYQPRRPLTIQGVSIDVAPGRRVAIVGPSGSGKSTIARILVGLLDPGAGDVDIGGRPRDSWPRSVSSHTVGYVSQDVSLFAGTIRDNVTMLDPRLSDEQVLRALQDAQILAEVQNRVGGLLHMVQDRGVGFSGGQIQRIGIARALVRDPRILVMDEATSALEPTTELLVDRAVRRRGCTTVVIAHRLSTVRDADEIIVVDRGQIVEQGTHDALIDVPGVYRRLVVG